METHKKQHVLFTCIVLVHMYLYIYMFFIELPLNKFITCWKEINMFKPNNKAICSLRTHHLGESQALLLLRFPAPLLTILL